MGETICYGRSIPSIGEQLYGTRDDMSDEEKTKEAQKVYDAVMHAFPNLRSLMLNTQAKARKLGYTETILGRRRHLPDMQLPEFEFQAMKNYVNPDVDPLDISTLENKSQIPERIVKQLTEEFKGYKYFGQIARRTRELYEQGIKVINNRPKINDATRQCVNCVTLDTEILTKYGWKTFDQVQEGDEILSYDLASRSIVWDTIHTVNTYEGEFQVVHFDYPCFYATSTLDHRWIALDSEGVPSFLTTQDICRDAPNSVKLLRMANNNFEDCTEYADNHLKLCAAMFTHSEIDENKLSNFISSLSQRQASIVFENLLQKIYDTDILLTKSQTNMLQYLAVVAGHATNAYQRMTFDSEPKYDIITEDSHISMQIENVPTSTTTAVWCPTTGTGTWVARCDGKVFITGNSVVQGEQRRPYSSNFITQRCAV